MKSVCIFFNVHLPFRLKKYQSGDIDVVHSYEDIDANRAAIDTAADECYLPANEILYRHLLANKDRFAVSFSISGIMLEMLLRFRPDVIRSFERLVDTGRVDILAETYYHSLSFLHAGHEFRRQVENHSALVFDIFGIRPSVFRNTALIYNNDLARVVGGMGYKGILCEGSGRVLKGRTANQLYVPPGNETITLLLRNRSLSDDIAFRFSDTDWQEYPLTANKFSSWVHASMENTDITCLCLDYATFGMHKHAGTGILDFLDQLPEEVLKDERFRFSSGSNVIQELFPRDEYDVPDMISWDEDNMMRNGHGINCMQHNTLKKIYAMETMVMGCGNQAMLDTWGQLQSADHFYCMAEDNTTYNRHPNPFASTEEAFRNYTNILYDFEISLIRQHIGLSRQKASTFSPVYTLY